MAVNPSMLHVFVSSTSEDLKVHRAVAQQVIIKLGWHPVMMESFGALPSATVDACKEKLKECQLVLLLVAWRRGFVPSQEQGGNGNDSITALELQCARSLGIPVLALMADRSWPMGLCETDGDAFQWINKFRDNLNLPVEWFPAEDATAADERRLPVFRDQAYKALLAHKERLLAEMTGGDSSSRVDFFARACRGLTDHKTVPFIGPGVFGSGPLGVRGLVDALQARATEARSAGSGASSDEQDPCLATVAEYCERYLGGRDTFLELLAKVLEEQSKQSPVPACYELLARAESRPELVVAATHDQMLENYLEAQSAGPYVVITHIIRSHERENDGKVLVLRPNEPPVITLADKVGAEMRAGELIVYRLLGSPLLHASLDPDLELDSVVITEADHVAFLGRLENPQTGVPSCLSRRLQRGALLFLGYGLNLWQYRLVMQMFQSAGGRERGKSMVAVRRPSSDMEELSWKRLGADLVPLDSNEFAQRVISTFATA